jgi:RNA polymerase sigma factor FliA
MVLERYKSQLKMNFETYGVGCLMNAHALQNTNREREQANKFSFEEQITKFRPLVQKIVHAMHVYESGPVSKDDLISAGLFGLLDACNKYDESMAVRFETYAYFRIRGAILDELRTCDPVSRSLRKKVRIIQDAYEIVEKDLGRSATDQEIIQFLGISSQEFYQTLQDSMVTQTTSLDSPIHADEQEQLQTLIQDPSSPDPLQELTRSEAEALIREVVERLPEKERMVITLYYYEEFTFKEIAEILNLSYARISQLHTKATYRLRGALSRRKHDIF